MSTFIRLHETVCTPDGPTPVRELVINVCSIDMFWDHHIMIGERTMSVAESANEIWHQIEEAMTT